MELLARTRRAVTDHPGLALVVPLLLCIAAYLRVLDAPFVFDDLGSVLRNPEAHGFSGQPGRFVSAWLGGGRPVTDLTFAANYVYGGLAPRNFHVTSLAVHLGVVVLAWSFVRRVLVRTGVDHAEAIAVLVAGTYALHPVQAEVVAYVAQRSEALAAGLTLAALLCVLEAEDRSLGMRAWPWLLAGLACFALAVGAKATAVTMPAAWLLVVLVLPAGPVGGQPAGWGRRLAAVAPFLALDLLYMSRLLGAIAGKQDVGFSVPQLSPVEYLATQLQVIPTYLRLLVWPSGLRIDWDYQAARSLGAPGAIAGGVLLLALVAGAVAASWRWRRADGAGAAGWRAASFGVLWLFLHLSVTSSVVPLKDLLAEHRLYLPSLGFLLAMGVVLGRALDRFGVRSSPGLAAMLAVAVWVVPAVALHARNAAWESPSALFEDCVRKSPWNTRAWLSYGHALSSEGRLEEAERVYRQALPLAAGDPAMAAQIRRNLASDLMDQGRLIEAERVLVEALGSGVQDADLLANLAVAKLYRGQFTEAEPLARRAVAISPQRPEAWNVLGEVALHSGRAGEALERFREAQRLDPGPELRLFNVGKALAALGRAREACEIWRTISAVGSPSMKEQKERYQREQGCGMR
jgi:Flp pilus assembly protein TadD